VPADGVHLGLTLDPERSSAADAVTDQVAADLAARLDGYNRRGVPVVVRFGEEMNGDRYSWVQQPPAYVAAFRRVAAAVHAGAPGSATVWAPAYGGGYPFSPVATGDTDVLDTGVLDTGGDGQVTGLDDPYAPYWPGEDAVDWAGLSPFH
jgi:beta-mannanase